MPKDAQIFLVPSTRACYAIGCALLFQSHLGEGEARPFFLIGITGTKGKTTVATYLYHILSQAKKRCAMIGTNGIFLDGEHRPTSNTTPDPYTLHETFSACAKAKVEYVILEVSSQAILQHRILGLHFDIAIFTNLSCDHVGGCEHRDFEDYKGCKKALFSHCDLAILNADDPYSAEFAASCTAPILTYAQTKEADFFADDITPFQNERALGVSFRCFMRDGQARTLSLSIPGEHNVANALGAIAAAHAIGVADSQVLARALLSPIAGRYRYTRLPNGAAVVIDYAHNPAALHACLSALRPFCNRRLICLFGSVGSRTLGRRKEMGKVASCLADECILTADDPDFESVCDICTQIAKGFPPSYPYCVIEDRENAVRYALSSLRAGDLLLLAGKGAEQRQKIAGLAVPYSDEEVLFSYCKELC